jgi:hypothetical protein
MNLESTVCRPAGHKISNQERKNMAGIDIFEMHIEQTGISVEQTLSTFEGKLTIQIVVEPKLKSFKIV